jgi:aspartokinase-like uncharacterized kinase
MPPVWVIKLGGSLSDSSLLRDWLELIARQGQGRAVIVPGGGGFAEQVRKAQQHWRFDDFHAHHMAVLAMQQMALLFQGLYPELDLADSPEKINQSLEGNRVVIWFPKISELNQASIPADWNITSDSLSAWLAQMLSAATLTLVKSCVIDKKLTISELIEKGIVDKAFNQYASLSSYHVKVLNRSDIDSFSIGFLK